MTFQLVGNGPQIYEEVMVPLWFGRWAHALLDKLELQNSERLKIGWLEKDVCSSGIPGETYDVVLSQHGYHYFPDKPGALKELRRLLIPGGRIGFSIWDGHSAYTDALCAALECHISPDIVAKQRSQRQNPSATDLYEQVTQGGFSDAAVHRHTMSFAAGATITLSYCISAHTTGAFARYFHCDLFTDRNNLQKTD